MDLAPPGRRKGLRRFINAPVGADVNGEKYMNVYEIKSMAERLDGNTYPGRGIVLGVTPDGKKAVAAYFIMGRSVNSRNRVFIQEPDGIRTEAHDPALMKDPHLIIYHPVRELGNGLIVTNGEPDRHHLGVRRKGRKLGSRSADPPV